jgi:hypothetical protein
MHILQNDAIWPLLFKLVGVELGLFSNESFCYVSVSV